MFLENRLWIILHCIQKHKHIPNGWGLFAFYKIYRRNQTFYMKRFTGKCTMCGKENTALTTIDEETRVCDECLEYAFSQCDICKEYWDDSCVEFFALKDGRLVCEHCADDFDAEDFEED